MRVTSQVQNQLAILNIQSIFSKMSKLQSQISSGNQVQNASDNPVGAVQILQNNTQLAQISSSLTTIQNATGTLQSSVNSLTQAQNILTSVKSAALSASNPANQATTNSTLAAQVNSAIQQLLGVANAQQADGTYLFSGASSNQQPFSISSTDGNGQATRIDYQGSQQTSQVIISKSVTVDTYLTGNSVFQPAIGAGTQYRGTTGAKASSVPDTATGTGSLQVVHTATSFSGASGISPGVSSAAGDTVLGPAGANKITINDTSGDGSSGTISLNGGPAVAYTNSDTDLQVAGPNGETIYVDTTTIAPGFSGSIDLTADGTLSTDGGTTTTPISFTSNQAVTDGTTGAVTNVDSSNIRTTGTDSIDYSGRSDIFQILIALRDTINNTNALSSSARSDLLTGQIAQLDQFNSSLAKPLGSQATQAQFLSSLKTHATSLQTDLKQSTSDIQSTDMAAAIVSLQQQQTLYQAGLQITASMNQLSLVNFIK